MPFRFVFATDLHGIEIHFLRLFRFVRDRGVRCVVLGGDLCPTGAAHGDFKQMQQSQRRFLKEFFLNQIRDLLSEIPDLQCLVIMGNDDFGANLDLLIEAEERGLLTVIHQKAVRIGDFQFLGYSHIPPTPFLIKDWEKYENANRIIEPIAIPPEDGYYSIPSPEKTTMADDLLLFTNKVQERKTIFVSHCPPYRTLLDQSLTDRYFFEGLRLDKHLGSIAIRDFIESAQPFVSLHGHIHESTSISGKFYDRIGNCLCFNGAFFVDDAAATEIILFEAGNELTFDKVTLA